MSPNKLAMAVAATLLMQHFSVSASVSDQSHNRFYERKAEGWFWYKKDPEPIEEPEPEEPEEPELVAASPPPSPAPVKPPPEPIEMPPDAFSSEWFRVNIPKYRDMAIDNPTLENVRAFYYVQRIAMDKSQRFADVAQRAVLGDPYLDESARRPSSTFAAKAMDREAEEEAQKLLVRLSGEAGFFFFFKADCEVCDLQAQVLEMLQGSIGFSVTAISMDGNPLDTGKFMDYKLNEGQAEMMGIDKAPALFLITPEGRFTPIGFTTMSFSDISYRTLLASIDLGLITEDDFNLTRAVDTSRDLQNMARDIADSESSLLLNGSNGREQAIPLMDKEGFIEPDRLLKAIQSSIKGE